MKGESGLFKRKGSKIWYFWYYEGSKRITKSTGKNLKDTAKKFVEDFLEKTEYKKLTLGEYAKDFYKWDVCQWLKRQEAKGRALSRPVAQNRRSHLERYILPEFGHIFLDKLNPVKIENFLISLPLSNQTKNHILYSLNIVIREAKREKIIKSNPLLDIEPLAVQSKTTDAFSLGDLRLLFPDTDLMQIWKETKYAAMFMIMATSGIRLSEARALMWKHIAWDKAAVFVLQAFKADKSLGEPKANEKRGIFLPDRTIDLLKTWQNESLFTGPDHLIFYGEGPDHPINRKTVYNHFMNGLQNAGINLEEKNYKVHSLRHTYNTLMRGILTENTLREFTGHRSEAMTDRYDSKSHLEERLDKLAASKKLIDSAFDFKQKEAAGA